MTTNLFSRSRLDNIRGILVVAVNTLVLANAVTIAIATYNAQRNDPVLHYTPAPLFSISDVILILLPIGIVAEVFRWWRLAEYVNVGYYAILFVWITGGTILAYSKFDGFSGLEHWEPLLVVMGLPSGLFAACLWWMYRPTRPRKEATQPAA